MRVDVFKLTNDDWYPSLCIDDDHKIVSVSFIQLRDGPGTQDKYWRVCAWGDDDFGLEKDFDSESKAWQCFVEAIGMECVDIEPLRSMGFVSA